MITCKLSIGIIQLSYAVQIPIFWLADLYHMILGCDEATTLTSYLSLCNIRGVNSTHHWHYTMALTDPNIMVSMQCFFVRHIQFE